MSRRPATRRTVAVLATLLLAACGDERPSTDTSPATTPPATESPATTPPTTESSVTESSVTEPPGPDPIATEPVPTDAPAPAGSPEGTWTVEHAMGSTVIEGPVERVVVLDSSFLDASIALGVVPVAATEGLAGSGLPPYLGAALDGIELVGLTNEPNLEQIAAMQPDLVLGAKVRHEAIYDQLSQIAPTVFSESSGTNWTEQVRITGASLGMPDEAAALLEQFEQRAASVGEAIGVSGRTATIVRFLPGQIRLYGPMTFSGSVLTTVGFDLGDKAYDPSFGMAVISAEQIEMIDADVIFATDPDTESGGAYVTDRDAVAALWSGLPAVQEGRQFDILDSTWMTGIGVLGANAILDDLEEWLG